MEVMIAGSFLSCLLVTVIYSMIKHESIEQFAVRLFCFSLNLVLNLVIIYFICK
jgi:hypothetical protein